PPGGEAGWALAPEGAMPPPVALLAHVPADPGRAAFWPLAEFSPEWVAIRWALAHDVPVRFIDLPAAHSLAMGEGEGDGGEEAEGGGSRGAVSAGRGEADARTAGSRPAAGADDRNPGPGRTG
ncbi:hypothetical protein ADK44_18175, partial [Streptomyces rimosus subsp. rimosus]|uniref:DUF5682 family protein n=1 Tax=Streptomyces rimosus TaxID=1927 RepID=UPI0006C6F478